MSAAHAYAKFYPRDWLGDPLLRMVSPQERGIWIDLLCCMMLAEPYGHLATNGKAMRDDDIARIVGVDMDTLKGAINHLLELGIPSRNEAGIIYSRRLVRDHAAFEAAQKSGKRGGNPALKSNNRSQNSEARSQKPEATQPLSQPLRVADKCKPSDLQEVMAYASEIELGKTDAEAFFDHFTSNGWRVGGKSPMRNWKAALRNWQRNAAKFSPSAKTGSTRTPVIPAPPLLTDAERTALIIARGG
jgi:hypothetical protein